MIAQSGYGLDYRGSRVRFPAGAVNFSPHYRVQNGSGAHPASYPILSQRSKWLLIFLPSFMKISSFIQKLFGYAHSSQITSIIFPY